MILDVRETGDLGLLPSLFPQRKKYRFCSTSAGSTSEEKVFGLGVIKSSPCPLPPTTLPKQSQRDRNKLPPYGAIFPSRTPERANCTCGSELGGPGAVLPPARGQVSTLPPRLPPQRGAGRLLQSTQIQLLPIFYPPGGMRFQLEPRKHQVIYQVKGAAEG